MERALRGDPWAAPAAKAGSSLRRRLEQKAIAARAVTEAGFAGIRLTVRTEALSEPGGSSRGSARATASSGDRISFLIANPNGAESRLALRRASRPPVRSPRHRHGIVVTLLTKTTRPVPRTSYEWLRKPVINSRGGTMSRRLARALATVLAAGLALSLGAAASAAPFAGLKQFKVPTANSQPRAITNGSDGNRWFTEGTEFTSSPAKIARITPAGDITEFAAEVADGCNFCIITDIAQGPGDILYITSNDSTLMRFNVATQSFETPVQMPNTGALAGSLGISATDVWITDFNNDVVWRYRISTGQFTSFPVSTRPTSPWTRAATPGSQPGDVAPGTSNIGRIDAATGTVTTPTTDGSVTVAPRDITVASDGQVWFTARFTPQAVGRLNPSNNSVTLFPVANTGPGHRRLTRRQRVVHPGDRRATPPGSPTPGSSPKARRSRAAAVRDRRRSQRRPLVHHDGREQDRHAAAALESGSESPFGLSGMTEAPLTRGFRSSSRRWAIPQPSCRGWARMLVDGVLHGQRARGGARSSADRRAPVRAQERLERGAAERIGENGFLVALMERVFGLVPGAHRGRGR